jgi:hypothetical protein
VQKQVAACCGLGFFPVRTAIFEVFVFEKIKPVRFSLFLDGKDIIACHRASIERASVVDVD